ncbi:hypothetical protein KI387_044553, partial [Taxus chinensis]
IFQEIIFNLGTICPLLRLDWLLKAHPSRFQSIQLMKLKNLMTRRRMKTMKILKKKLVKNKKSLVILKFIFSPLK